VVKPVLEARRDGDPLLARMDEGFAARKPL
jgi:hypothetical protein